MWNALKAEVEQVETRDVNAFDALLQANTVPGVIAVVKKGTIL